MEQQHICIKTIRNIKLPWRDIPRRGERNKRPNQIRVQLKETSPRHLFSASPNQRLDFWIEHTLRFENHLK
uniref:Uncharacterized protein n=1 Tax=Rhizophora mucronata TaxID=61149 RepID=A0A2P2MWK7_RHIMU